MAYNHGREDRKWRIWKEAEEKLLRECGVDEATIEQIRIADRADFNSNRRFYRWTNDVAEYLEDMADRERQTEVGTVAELLDEIESENLYQVLVKSGGNGLVGLLHGKGGELSIPKPFEKDIFLFDTYVAGTTHIEGIEELEPHLNNDDRLEFFREPDNRYDKQAIVIKTVNGVKIGYVPKQDNVIFARLMDAGKLLFGKITSKEKKGSWVKIYIKVFLHE
ncbi:HIRAN domain-containing protein [Anaerofustis sp. LCP19S3_F7]|uniref:HIRAN domain-containing protein n=1 Tax=Anaerofustis sp. LCP19S3_F7 TaxID=3440247 RepID=UPI003F934BDA